MTYGILAFTHKTREERAIPIHIIRKCPETTQSDQTDILSMFISFLVLSWSDRKSANYKISGSMLIAGSYARSCHRL